MNEHYFLGREQTGDEESGPDGGDCYDGNIWCVDPDDPDARPVVFVSVNTEEEAVRVLKVIEDRQVLLAALTVAHTRLLKAYTIRVKMSGFAGGELADEIKMISDAIEKARR